MSQLALARHYRPRTFQAIVGQEAPIRTLMSALNTQRLHHAYLFTGTRGVGKTTIARILAKCLNCETGITAVPCEQCITCRSINEGRLSDLLEVDAASRTKVEDTRELLDNVQYLPTHARFKIYLIDEVHMLSGHSFNALLKTLEEPPPHVKFILATTDPQKLPATVLSRCLQFHLKRLSFRQIVDHLQVILKQESVEFEIGAVEVLARAAEGSMRDGLSLLDQALAYGRGCVRTIDVCALLGLTEHSSLLELLSSLAASDAAKAFEIIQGVGDRVPDFVAVLRELLTLIHTIALAQTVPEILEDNLPERDEILRLSEVISPEAVQLYYQIGLMGQRDLPYAPTPQMGFEMVILRMFAFQPIRVETIGMPAQQHSDLKSHAMPSEQAAIALKLPETRLNSVMQLDMDWASMIPKLNLTGIAKALADHCTWIEHSGDLVQLRLDESQRPLLSKRAELQLQAALTQHMGKAIRLTISTSQLTEKTPALIKQENRDRAYQQAYQCIETDPTVQRLISHFDADIEQVSSR